MRACRPRPAPVPRSAFVGDRFPADVIVLAVRWHLRFGLSYRDVDALLVERGVGVDHVTVYRRVQRFTPLPAEAAGPAGTPPVLAGSWMRPTSRWLAGGGTCTERSTSSARSSTCLSPTSGCERCPSTLPADDRCDERRAGGGRHRSGSGLRGRARPAAAGCAARTDRYANDRVEADHGRRKARLRPTRGRKRDGSARVITAGHAFVQNLRRGHDELAAAEPATRRVAVAFDELAVAI
jgi:transposase, IS6 family